MQSLFDNLIAVAVGAVLVGIIAVIGLRQQTEAVSLAEQHFASGRTAALSDWLRSDLLSLTAVTVLNDSRFVFTRSTNPDAGGTAEVEYALVCESSTPSRCRFVRREAGTERTIGPDISAFMVTLLTSAGQPTTVPGIATSVRVRVLTPAGRTGGLAPATSVWERTYRPRMLGRTTV